MAENKLKKKRGRPPKHGGYSFLVKGALPENRKHIREYLFECRRGWIEDIGPAEDDLSTSQKVLIDKATSLLGITRCIEEHVREQGVFQGNKLNRSLGDNYLSYVNSIRLILRELGISKRAQEEPLSLRAYVNERYGDNKEEKKSGTKK